MTKKKKTTSKKKVTARAAKNSAGKASASKKKATTRKPVTKKKRTAKKSATKKTSTKKSSTKKSTAKKSTSKSSRTASKKKATNKKTTAKKTASKKTTAKKKSTRKTNKSKAKVSTATSASAKATAAGNAGADGAPKIKKKRQTKRVDSRRRGRSVAEVASSAPADEKGYVFINGRRVRMISTQGMVFSKKPKAAQAEEPVEAETIKFGKTNLSRKELNYYRGLLLIKRAELIGDLSAIEAAALRSSGGELSHMPIHMADIGSDTYDQDFMLGLAESERKQLREIDDALARIEDRTYGVCQMTGKDIPKARLEAKPWAKYTIEAARVVEARTQR